MNEFDLIQGTTKILKCTIYDADAKTLLDIQQAPTIQFGAKRYGEGGAAVITKDLNDGIVVTGLGTMEITLDPLDTENLSGKFQYEIRITDISNNVFVPVAGLFIVNAKSI
jgi:hypothetical protein